MACIGLDIGTTHACVGVSHNGKVQVIANDEGGRTLPCYVAFVHDEDTYEELVGEPAMKVQQSESNHVVYHFKHALGKSLEDVKDTALAQDWSFHHIDNEKAQLIAPIQQNKQDRSLEPHDFSSIIMEKLKALAEDFTGEKVEHAVITVPVHYSEAEQALIKDAAEKAGLNIMRMIVEPAAAMVAYGLDVKEATETPELNLIVDLGGSTYDATVMSVDKGCMNILESVSGNDIGGEFFTKALVDHCVKTFERQSKINVSDNARAMRRVKLSCENAKRSLSQQNRVTIEVDGIAEGQDMTLKVSSSRFEDMIVDDIKRLIERIEACLDASGYDKEQIDKVILVGGSARIPLVQRMVEKAFNGKKSMIHITPDEAYAQGAAIEAQALFELRDCEIKDVDTVDVVPLSLGLKAANGAMVHILQRESVLPASHIETFETSVDNQTNVFLEVYEGERLMAKDNTLLAQFCLDGITQKPKGQVSIEVEFHVTRQGELQVTAKEKVAGVENVLQVHHDSARLTAEKVDQLVQEAEDAAEEDDELIEKLEQASIVPPPAPAAGQAFEEEMD